jgi:hypothetical protein
MIVRRQQQIGAVPYEDMGKFHSYPKTRDMWRSKDE